MDVVASANSVEFDHELTSAGLKSRSAVGLPQCYLPLRSTGEIAGETARVRHAPRRRGGVAPRGAGAADRDAGDWIPQWRGRRICALPERVPPGTKDCRVRRG